MRSALSRFSPGLRIGKTALAAALAVLLARVVTDEPLSLFYAAFGALIAMETTVSRALRQGLTQLVGVACGTLLGYVSVLLFSPPAPFWVVGLGLFLLLFVLNALRLNFSASLACIIFLSSCVIPTENVVHDSVQRLLSTAIGLVTALVVNVCIRPYNNRRRILSLLDRLRACVPESVASVVARECIPELQPAVALLRSLDRELELYHSQRFLRRQDDEAVLSGCRQLAQRMVQELEVICGMDSLGELNAANAERLRALGIDLPAPAPRHCDPNDTVVMNYHLEKLLTAYDYLGELMRE